MHHEILDMTKQVNCDALLLAQLLITSPPETVDKHYSDIVDHMHLSVADAEALRGKALLMRDAIEHYMGTSHPTNVPVPLGLSTDGVWGFIRRPDRTLRARVTLP